MPEAALSQAPYADRVAFLTELAGQLHAYGTTAQRLEGALLGVAARLGVACEPWVNPTGMILTFRDPANLQAPDLTRVIRMPPGDTDLSRLSRADRIAEDVVAGRMGVAEGRDALERIELPRTVRWRVMQVAAFAMVAAAVAVRRWLGRRLERFVTQQMPQGRVRRSLLALAEALLALLVPGVVATALRLALGPADEDTAWHLLFERAIGAVCFSAFVVGLGLLIGGIEHHQAIGHWGMSGSTPCQRFEQLAGRRV